MTVTLGTGRPPPSSATLDAVSGVVELHVISDATGATAKRLVQALEAQFPDQDFEDIVHPRVETVDDLRLAVSRAKGRPAVVDLHARRPGDARGDARPLQARTVHYCDLLGHPIDAVARVSGQAGAHDARRPAAARLAVLPPDGGDRVRRQVRRRRRLRASTTRTSSSSGSRAPRRRRCRCTSATSATRPRTSRS